MLDSNLTVVLDLGSVWRKGKEASLCRFLFDTCEWLPQWSCFAFPALPHCNVKKACSLSCRIEAEAYMMSLICRSLRRGSVLKISTMVPNCRDGLVLRSVVVESKNCILSPRDLRCAKLSNLGTLRWEICLLLSKENRKSTFQSLCDVLACIPYQAYETDPAKVTIVHLSASLKGMNMGLVDCYLHKEGAGQLVTEP